MRMYHGLKKPGVRFPTWLRVECVFLLMIIVAGLILINPYVPSVAAEAVAGSNDIIRSGAEIAYPPFSIVDKNGAAGGFSVELMRAALAAMGREVRFRTGPWTEVRGWLERGEIDALPLVGRTPEREALFDFTVPYMSLHGAIVVRGDEVGIRDFSDLSGRQVAVMKGDNTEEFLRREARDFEIRTTPTFEVALQELAEGRHDAVVTQRLVALRLIQKTGLTDLTVIDRPIEDFRQDFCFAVQEGDRDTLALLNEGLAIVVADGTYRHLHAKWFADMQLPTERPIIVGGDRNFPPFEFLDDSGRPAGYNVDLTRAIAREMGLNVKIRLGRWSERVEALKTGKIDVLQGMFYSPARDLNFDFTQAHTVSHCVAVVRQGEGPLPVEIETLRGKRIVAENADIMNDYAIENGLEKQISLVDDQETALRELTEGRHDVALVSRVVALYLIDQHGWGNLELGKKPLVTTEYGYAAAKGQKALLAQFSEGLKVLENSGEYRRIYDKWLGVYQEEPVSFMTALRYSAFVIIPLLMILLMSVVWSWALRRQVAVKTKEVQENLDRFRYVFEAANAGKSMTLPTGEVNANKAFADFLGYTLDELKGQRWQDITPAEDIDAIENTVAPLLKGEKDAVRFEKRYVHKNGELLWADVSATIRRDADGTPLYFMTTVVDITKRKNAEEQFKSLFMESPVSIIIHDKDTGEIIDANPRAWTTYGFSSLCELKTNDFWMDPPYSFQEALQLIQKADQEGPQRFEWLNRKKSGEHFWEDVHLGPIQIGGIKRIMAVSIDITERKNIQNKLMQAQKMESVGRLAGGVAHDYNNMLSIIIGFTEDIQEKIGPDDPLQEDLQEILSAAKRSTDITRQLLAFARQQTIAPKVFDLNEAVETILKMLRRLIGEDIDLAWQPGPGRMPVFMDPSQLDQLLANLCVNARDAIKGVGKLTIETDHARFDKDYCADHVGFIPGEFIMLAVSDDGVGIDKDTLDNIFEPFFTTKGVGEGTGLGLSTVFGIVKQNDGFINVYSEPGKGTTFKIYLPPREHKDTEIESTETAEIPTGRGETVLVVEDEAPVLKMVQRILKPLGYSVLIAATPKEAVALAEKHAGDIHLLITDVVMPEMNGCELAQTLQAAYPALKVLFMSGYTANVIAHQGVLDAGVSFIQKPFSKQNLAIKVLKVLES